jgi:hypothetical protein
VSRRDDEITPAKAEVLRGQHAAGLKADMMLRAYGEMHATREKQIVDELIAWFVSQDWDERTAIRYIAKLSENRAQHEELEHRARKGIQARSTLFGGTTADN